MVGSVVVSAVASNSVELLSGIRLLIVPGFSDNVGCWNFAGGEVAARIGSTIGFETVVEPRSLAFSESGIGLCGKGSEMLSPFLANIEGFVRG